MAKKSLVEFQCNDCNGWIILNLNLSLRGDFVVVCPNCLREHPRKFIAGEMAQSTHEVRVTHPVLGLQITRKASEGAKERIVPMMSAYSKTKRLNLVNKIGCGFLEEAKMMALAREKGLIDGLEKYED